LCPKGMEACHNDGNRLNNKINNLRWDTLSNNQLDRKKHGTESYPVNYGENVFSSKLKEADINKIRNTPHFNGIVAHFAKEFNVCKSTIRMIIQRKTWKHI